MSFWDPPPPPDPPLLPKELPPSPLWEKRDPPPKGWLHPRTTHLPSTLTPSHPGPGRRSGGRMGMAAGGQRGPSAAPRGAGREEGVTGCRSLCLLVGRSIPRQTPRLAACALSSPLISLSK